ncbi:MAG: M24 family metallopeptidase [Patescibacteria group bacterium]
MTEEQIKNHKIAAEKLDAVKNAAFDFIKKNLGRVTEYDVNKFIFSEFKKERLAADGDYPSIIVAANSNSAFVHYFPERKKSLEIGKNCLILLDIWARLDKKDAPFADITWMGYTGKRVPPEIKKTFSRVAGARDFCVRLIKNSLKMKKLPKTNEVDGVVRKYFGKMGKYFIHGAGHSLGIEQCHGKYFRFGKKSCAKVKTGIPFTIEPGIYFKGKFGARSEINCYITKDYKLKITTKVQKEITKI